MRKITIIAVNEDSEILDSITVKVTDNTYAIALAYVKLNGPAYPQFEDELRIGIK